MANIIPTRPRYLGPQRRNYAIVASQYHPALVQGLVEHFEKELDAIVPGANISRHEVPGAFEIPVMVQEVAAAGSADAIVAFGVVIEGETHHAQFLGQAVTNALMDCALRYRIPVVHEVLVVRNEEQARVRCLGDELNRGTEAARTAVRIAQSISEFKNR